MHIGWTEVIVVLVLFLMLFGTAKLPDMARSIGKALKEFRKGMKDVTEEISGAGEEEKKE